MSFILVSVESDATREKGGGKQIERTAEADLVQADVDGRINATFES